VTDLTRLQTEWEDSHVDLIFSYWLSQFVEICAMPLIENANMYVAFIKEIVALFVTNSALAIMLLTGEYLMNTSVARLMAQQATPNKREELNARTEKIYKLSDDLVDRCSYLKAVNAHSPLSDNEFLLEILNKEKIFLHHQNEAHLVLKKMIKKGSHHGKIVAKLLQGLPQKTLKTILGVTEDEINQAFVNPAPSTPAPSRKNSSRTLKPVTIMHKEKPELNSHQMKMAMFLGRIRAVLIVTEKLYQNWGWRSLYAQQNKYMENYMIRQVFLLSNTQHFLLHETVFFNNPTLYICFQKLYELISYLIEVLASVLNEVEWTDYALGPLGLVVTQIKFSAAKLVSVQYATPGLFELL